MTKEDNDKSFITSLLCHNLFNFN